MKRIDTLVELRIEKRRLIIQKNFLETELRKDFEEIKEELVPLMLLTKSAEKALVSKDNSIMGNSLGYIASLLAKSAFKNSGLITRFVMPFLIKNTTSNIVEDNKTQIVDWLGNLISKFRNKTTSKS